jgi:hypothetical protein
MWASLCGSARFWRGIRGFGVGFESLVTEWLQEFGWEFFGFWCGWRWGSEDDGPLGVVSFRAGIGKSQ